MKTLIDTHYFNNCQKILMTTLTGVFSFILHNLSLQWVEIHTLQAL
jgi:hypothetical protein